MMRYLYRNSLTKICAAGVLAVLLPLAAFAATGNGCDDVSGNEYINPELALCTTHVYNIGGDQNPNSDAQREIMKDVVALKTTVMTQQMYKQYEYLESMMKRFKTQLEKAVLTTKLEASGASTSSNNSSSSMAVAGNGNNDRYVILDSARNCNNETGGKLAVYECLQNNISAVLNAVSDNKTSEAKRQLSSDINVANTWGITNIKNCNTLSSANSITNCAYSLRVAVSNATDEYNKANRAVTYQQK